jgi:hypothetical protein
LTLDIQNNEIFPTCYTIYRKDRTPGNKKCGGGAFLMIRSNLVSIELKELDTNCEIVWAQIQLKGNKFLNVGSFCCPDHTDDKYLDELRSSLSRICSKSHHTWLGGDFNLPDIIWDTESIKPSGRRPRLCQQLLDISNDHGLTQVQEQNTRESNNLDLLFTNHPSLVNRANVIPGISDHDIPIFDINLKATPGKQQRRRIFVYRKANTEAIQADLTTFFFSKISPTETMEIGLSMNSMKSSPKK